MKTLRFINPAVDPITFELSRQLSNEGLVLMIMADKNADSGLCCHILIMSAHKTRRIRIECAQALSEFNGLKNGRNWDVAMVPNKHSRATKIN